MTLHLRKALPPPRFSWLAACLFAPLAMSDPPVPVASPVSPPPAAESVTVPAPEQPLDQGVSMRAAALRDLPDRSGNPVGELPPNTPVLLYERSRLWVRVRPLNAPQAPAAWASLLDFRFGAPPAAPRVTATAPGSTGGFAGFSRSVSSLLAGFRGREYSSGNTATIGIRGLTSAELGAAPPNFQALAQMESFTSSPQDAQNYAFAGGLVPQRLPYLAPPTPAASAPTQGAPRQNPFR